jgi:uncharacterized membrane protein YkoI
MLYALRRVLSFTAAALLMSAALIYAAEKKIQAKDLPPAVQQAVAQETRGATIKGYAREVEGGKTMFEVETTVNGHSRDLLFDASGKLIEVEEATSLDDVPAAVKAALEARGRVLTVESVTRGKTVTYEGTVEKSGRKSEISVTADGKPVK